MCQAADKCTSSQPCCQVDRAYRDYQRQRFLGKIRKAKHVAFDLCLRESYDAMDQIRAHAGNDVYCDIVRASLKDWMDFSHMCMDAQLPIERCEKLFGSVLVSAASRANDFFRGRSSDNSRGPFFSIEYIFDAITCIQGGLQACVALNALER